MGVGAGPYMYVVVVQKFMFAISSPDEFLLFIVNIVLIYTGIGLALGLVLALTLVLHDKTPL